MRIFIPYFCIAVLGVMVLSSQKHTTPEPMPAGSTIFDTALKMLQEFVIEGQDTNLGFKNPQDVLGARIDTNQGVDIYYLREDSLLHSDMPIDSQIVKLNRRAYPVYLGDSLRSTITFMHAQNGWLPVMFDDYKMMESIINDLPKRTSLKSLKHSYALVEAPFVQTQLSLKRETSGTSVLPNRAIHRVMGNTVPLANISRPYDPIKANVFAQGLKAYSRKRIKR